MSIAIALAMKAVISSISPVINPSIPEMAPAQHIVSSMPKIQVLTPRFSQVIMRSFLVYLSSQHLRKEEVLKSHVPASLPKITANNQKMTGIRTELHHTMPVSFETKQMYTWFRVVHVYFLPTRVDMSGEMVHARVGSVYLHT